MKAKNLIAFRLLAATLILALAGCSIEKPQAPSWDVDLNVPLINKRFSSSELFEKLAADNIITDSSGNSFFQVDQQLDTVGIDATLQLASLSSQYQKQVGRIKIAAPAPQQQQLALSDYIPLSAGYVPDTGLWVEKPFAEPGTFSQAVVDDGDLIISAHNNTGFMVDSITCELLDNQSAAVILTWNVPGGLEDAASHQGTVPLDGKNISNDLTLNIYFHTLGGMALSLADRELDFDFAYSNDIYVSSATARTEPFEVGYRQQVRLDSDYQIESATLAGGELSLEVENNLALPVDLLVSFPEITSHGQPLQLELSLSAQGQLNEQLDLTDYVIAPVDDSLLTEIDATVLSSGGQLVTVAETDDFSFILDVSDVLFGQARAVVTPTAVEWTESTIDIDIPEGFGNASLEDVSLELQIANGSELSGDLQISLEADHGAVVLINGVVAPGSSQAPVITSIYSDDLAQLLSPVPNWIRVTGAATVSGDGSAVDISSSDFFSAKAHLSAPMHFTLEPSAVEGDKEAVEIDSDISERADRLHEGSFYATVTNHLPVGASVTIYIATDSATLYTDPLVTIGPVSFTGATTGGSGIVTGEVVSDNLVQLTTEQLQVFQNSKIYIGQVVELPGTDGQPVKIQARDYLDIVGYVSIAARVGGEDFF